MDSATLETRLRILLPETYAVFDDAVQPRSMGSAGLKYGSDGKVAWDDIWRSFCDLAMAGGPPHRGKLLAPPALTPDEAASSAYHDAAAEICRGLHLVTGLCAEPAPDPGSVRLYCTTAAMAGWLARAITMENVSASSAGLALHLPAGPAFRVEKEIKNVITSTAKTCHFWQSHKSDEKRDSIAALLRLMQRERPLVTPSLHTGAPPEALATLTAHVAAAIHAATGLTVTRAADPNWLGLDCPTPAAAIWLMRALAASNVLARREDTAVFLPLNPAIDPSGDTTVAAVIATHHLAQQQDIL